MSTRECSSVTKPRLMNGDGTEAIRAGSAASSHMHAPHACIQAAACSRAVQPLLLPGRSTRAPSHPAHMHALRCCRRCHVQPGDVVGPNDWSKAFMRGYVSSHMGEELMCAVTRSWHSGR